MFYQSLSVILCIRLQSVYWHTVCVQSIIFKMLCIFVSVMITHYRPYVFCPLCCMKASTEILCLLLYIPVTMSCKFFFRPQVKCSVDNWVDQTVGHAKEENTRQQFLALLKKKKQMSVQTIKKVVTTGFFGLLIKLKSSVFL